MFQTHIPAVQQALRNPYFDGLGLPRLYSPIEPPWYGPVCPVVWEGRHREGSPYPDHISAVQILLELRQSNRYD
jgi:hypothetical protein